MKHDGGLISQRDRSPVMTGHPVPTQRSPSLRLAVCQAVNEMAAHLGT